MVWIEEASSGHDRNYRKEGRAGRTWPSSGSRTWCGTRILWQKVSVCVLHSFIKPAKWWDPAQTLNEHQPECAGTTLHSPLAVKVAELLLLHWWNHNPSQPPSKNGGPKSQAHGQLTPHLWPSTGLVLVLLFFFFFILSWKRSIALCS